MAISETRLLNDALEALRTRLPPSWEVNSRGVDRPGAWQPDALVEIRAPDGGDAVVILEAKKGSVEPRDVPLLLARLSDYARASRGEYAGCMLVAPFLSPRTRHLLADAGVAYADGTGNLRLSLAKPAVFIETPGASSSPWREPRSLHSLRGPTAGRVVRALCDFRPPFGIRDLASRSATPPASVSRVVTLLEREALVTRQPTGAVLDVMWDAVIRRWAEDYSLVTSNRTETFLGTRGLSAISDQLRSLVARYAVTGSLAATLVAPIAAPRLATIYVDDIEQASAALGLRPAQVGANVLLAERFDPVVFDRTWTRDDLVCAALPQVAADLLTSPGRGPAEADELLRWMGEHESDWRRA